MEADERENDDSPKAKLAYEPPAIVETAEFETLAMQCGLTSGFQCTRNGGVRGS